MAYGKLNTALIHSGVDASETVNTPHLSRIRNGATQMTSTTEPVQRWLSYIENNNPQTAKYYRQKIRRFEEISGVKPADLLRMSQRKRSAILDDYVVSLQQLKLTPKTQVYFLGVVKSLLAFTRKPTPVSIKIHHTNTTPTLKNERVPEHNELKDLFNRLSPRLRASAALIGFGGLRYQTQVKLQIEDLIDFNLETLAFTKTPALIYVPAEKSKNRRQYFTFMIKEGAEYLEAYLKDRWDRGERLNEQSYVLTAIDGEQLKVEPLRNDMRHYTHQVLNSRAYVLRSYFNTSLLAAGVHPDWKRFFTGHKGDIEEMYSTRKQLPEWAIEKMREAFTPAVKQLSLIRPDTRDQERTAALTTMKILEGYFDRMQVDPNLKIALQNMQRQLQAVIPPA